MHQAQSCAQHTGGTPGDDFSASGLLRLSLDRLKAAAHFAVLQVPPKVHAVPAQLLCAPRQSAVKRLIRCPTAASQLQRAACSLCSVQMPPQVPHRCLTAAVCAPADAYNGLWDSSSDLPDPVSSYYLSAMDAMYPLCNSCLFLVQGTGTHPCLYYPVPQPWRSCLLWCPLLVVCIQSPFELICPMEPLPGAGHTWSPLSACIMQASAFETHLCVCSCAKSCSCQWRCQQCCVPVPGAGHRPPWDACLASALPDCPCALPLTGPV